MKKAFIALMVLLLATQARASVALNNANTDSCAGGTGQTLTMSVMAGGSNLCAFAEITYDNQSGQSGAAITSVTWNGVAMTAAGTPAAQTTNYVYSTVYYLANPATGSHSLVVTGNSKVSETFVNLVSFSGCNQSTPVRSGTYTTNSGTASGTTASLTVSSNPSDLTLTTLQFGNNPISGTSQSADWIDNGCANNGAGDHATTGASSVTHTWTDSASGQAFAIAGFSIMAAGGAAAKNCTIVLLGAGVCFVDAPDAPCRYARKPKILWREL